MVEILVFMNVLHWKEITEPQTPYIHIKQLEIDTMRGVLPWVADMHIIQYVYLKPSKPSITVFPSFCFLFWTKKYVVVVQTERNVKHAAVIQVYRPGLQAD